MTIANSPVNKILYRLTSVAVAVLFSFQLAILPPYNTHGGSVVLTNLRGNSLIESMPFFSDSL